MLRADPDEADPGAGSAHIALSADSQASATETCHILRTHTARVPIPRLADGLDERSLKTHDGMPAFAGPLNPPSARGGRR